MSVTVDLYGTDGTTHITALPLSRAVKWLDELSLPGSGSFDVPADDTDTASITDRRIIKFSLYGAARFAVRVSGSSMEHAVEGRRWLQFQSQPGLLSMLADGSVWPEYGLARRPPSGSGTDRNFGFMSIRGSWYVTADWVAPNGYAYSAETTVRKNYPPELKASDPAWISVSGPAVTVSAGTVNWFRREFTLATAKNASWVGTADNFQTLYIDGEAVATPDPSQPYAWRTSVTVPVVLAAGDHVIAARVENAPPTLGANPLAFIGTLFELDAAGNTIGTILKTDTTNWVCTDVEPGWFRAQMLKKMIEEKQARDTAAGVTSGVSHLSLGFTDSHDSDGVAWSVRETLTFAVSTINLCDVGTQLASSHLDLWLDPATMTLNAYVRRGSDLSGSVALTLGDAGGNLKSYVTTSSSARQTSVLSQLLDGTWVETRDTAGMSAAGYIEAGVTVGSTISDSTARGIARAQLDESAQPQIAATAQPSSLSGLLAYTGWGNGDSITVPGHLGSTMRARITGTTVDASGEVLDAYPELVEDLS